eukprot:6202182-Pleurochrysis_carterae.AAC.4
MASATEAATDEAAAAAPSTAASMAATAAAAVEPTGFANQLKDVKRKLNLAYQDAAALRKELRDKAAADQRARRRNPLEAENAELRDKLNTLEGQRQQLLRDKRWGMAMGGVKKEANEVKEELRKVQRDKAAVEAGHMASQAGQQYACGHVDQLRESLKIAGAAEKKELEAVKKAMSKLRKDLEETRRERDAFCAERDTLRAERDAARRERDAAADEADASKRQMQADLKAAQDTTAQLQTEMQAGGAQGGGA